MALEQKKEGIFISVLGSEGDFRRSVPEGTVGAKKRTYETSDGKTGEKWELAYKSISGRITDVQFFDGDYGKNILITFGFDNDEEPVTVSLGCATPFGEDVMKKLPNVNFNEWVSMTPYSFEDEKGRPKKGMTIRQGDVKIGSFFTEAVTDKKGNTTYKTANGYPEPGDTSGFDTDDWKIYFTQARKFLVKHTEDTIVPMFAGEVVDSTPSAEEDF